MDIRTEIDRFRTEHYDCKFNGMTCEQCTKKERECPVDIALDRLVKAIRIDERSRIMKKLFLYDKEKE